LISYIFLNHEKTCVSFFSYLTVNKDRKGQKLLIPERCVWWVAKVEGTGDDQVWNRMLTVWIDESRDQDRKVKYQALILNVSLNAVSGISRQSPLLLPPLRLIPT